LQGAKDNDDRIEGKLDSVERKCTDLLKVVAKRGGRSRAGGCARDRSPATAC